MTHHVLARMCLQRRRTRTYTRSHPRRLAWLTALVLVGTAVWWLPAIGPWLAQSPQPERADAIVVLGGGVRRLEHGIELYKLGLADSLWLTGDPPATHPDSGWSARFSIRRGVPAEDISLLKTTSTWQDAQQVAGLALERDAKGILVVTDWWHSRRALCAVRKHLDGTGISIYYDPPAIAYSPHDWWRHQQGRVRVVRELAKLAFYWPRHGLVPWHCAHPPADDKVVGP